MLGYYGYAEFARDDIGDTSPLNVWFVLAFIAGPIFGLAGSWWRDTTVWQRGVGAGVLGAVFGTDGLWHLIRLKYVGSGLAFLTIAVLIPLVLGLLTTAVIAPAALGVYYLIDKSIG